MEDTTSQETARIAPMPAKQNALAIPIAIVFGFGLVAVAIFFSGKGAPAQNVVNNVPAAGTEQAEAEIKGPVRPVDGNDHILGNPNAPIVIVEYSDFDCPFCKNFHETMNQVMKEYGATGKVAWVYRHFPLEQRHPSAPRIAAASECVAKLGGNDAFWKFSDLVFGERGTNEPTNITRLNEFAVSSGVSGTAFDSCLENGETKAQVDEDLADGINAGAQGTPYSLVLVGGQQGVINGAQPYKYVKSVLDTLITQVENKKTEEGQ
jgi:protein-disulfide isomerase